MLCQYVQNIKTAMLNKISAIMKKMYENKILEIPDNNNYKGNWDDVTGLFTPEREITS